MKQAVSFVEGIVFAVSVLLALAAITAISFDHWNRKSPVKVPTYETYEIR